MPTFGTTVVINSGFKWAASSSLPSLRQQERTLDRRGFGRSATGLLLLAFGNSAGNGNVLCR